jgi:hypothetical protein
MRTLSACLSLAIACFVVATVINIRHDDFMTATHLIGWTFALLAVLVGFVWPTRCEVETSLRRPCRNEAYGFLFGCWQSAHHLDKFLVRVRMNREITRSTRRGTTESRVSALQMPPESEPLKVSVENDVFSIMGFWIGAVSAITGIAQVVIAVR